MATTKQSLILRQALANKQLEVEALENNIVNTMKASELEIEAAIESLNKLKIEQNLMERKLKAEAVKKALENGLFIIPSFKLYGRVAGLYDYGPPGCALKSNILAFWRKHFVLEEAMLEVDCCCVTPEAVFKASGHVDKFTDLMVKDMKTGIAHRADHVLKDFCEEKLVTITNLEQATELRHLIATLDNLSAQELGAKIREYNVTAPDTGNPLSDPYPFNLMFRTSIGPSAIDSTIGYLRPETAQGIFVNFEDLYQYNGKKLPFAAAQIGQAFRNEISPRNVLLRVREFTLAEIEHFVDPEDKSHAKFSDVANLELMMLPREEQTSGHSPKRIQLGEAVAKGIINNETLGYFIGRVYLFLTHLGIEEERLRFRQHLANEMAHYACDCWDAEIECSYGWIECVGIADRSAYDLRAHSLALVASKRLSEPIEVEKLVITTMKKELGPAFKENKETIVNELEAMNEREALKMRAELESKGKVDFYVGTLGRYVSIKKEMVSISKEKRKVHRKNFTPSVVEPSFGIGRIIYCLCEHSFYIRPSIHEDEELKVFRFSPFVAPIKCTIFPLIKNEQFENVAKDIAESLTAANISHKIDITGTSIGKKYARTDELGVPFAITVDSTSHVTIRERDSKHQIRVNVEEATCIVKELTSGLRTWADLWSTFPRQSSKEL